jgi:hypothetical protein
MGQADLRAHAEAERRMVRGGGSGERPLTFGATARQFVIRAVVTAGATITRKRADEPPATSVGLVTSLAAMGFTALMIRRFPLVLSS